jgi:hypothetical protein
MDSKSRVFEIADCVADLMPSSGPGRQATIKKKSSLKKKRKKDAIVTSTAAEDRGRRPSMLPADVMPDGTLLDDDSYAMNAMRDQVRFWREI